MFKGSEPEALGNNQAPPEDDQLIKGVGGQSEAATIGGELQIGDVRKIW